MTTTSTATAGAEPPAPPAGGSATDALPERPHSPRPSWLFFLPPAGGPADAVTALTFYLVLLFGLSERLVVAALGALGAPATIFSLGLFGWWVLGHLVPSLTRRGRQPLRQALVVLLTVTMGLYAMSTMRGLPGVEQRAADRYMLGLLGVGGVALVIADGVRTRARLDVLLQRLTVAGAGLSLLGLVQQFTGWIYAASVRVPGLTVNGEILAGGVERGTLDRISGTANHPIGYGVPLALMLPIAVHYALHAEKGPERQWRTAVAFVVAAGVPLALSRSGVVALGVALFTLQFAWSWRRRINALGVGLVGLVLIQALMPGRLKTLVDIFTNYDSDASVTARTRDYEAVFTLIDQNQIFGLGPGVFIPGQYIQLDNQALKFMLEGGLVGCSAMVLLYVTGVRLARCVRRVSTDEETRHLCQALVAVIVAAGLTCFTFDSFSYSFYVAVLFVALGAAGALWRLTLAEHL